jgi:thioredoxin 1
MASKNVIEITDDSFQREVLTADKPALIDFWATWCAPCRAIAPLVEQLSETYAGQVKFGKFDIDANPKVPTQYEIRSIPTLLMFKGGQVVGQIVGAVPKAKIEDLIKRAL